MCRRALLLAKWLCILNLQPRVSFDGQFSVKDRKLQASVPCGRHGLHIIYCKAHHVKGVDKIDVQWGSNVKQCALDAVSSNCNSEIKRSHPSRNGDPLKFLICESHGRGSTLADNGRFSFCKLLNSCVRKVLCLFHYIEQLILVFGEELIGSHMKILAGVLERCCGRSCSLSNLVLVSHLSSSWVSRGSGWMAAGCLGK